MFSKSSQLNDFAKLLTLLLFSCQVISDSFAIPWIEACQAPLSIGFPRQEYWNGLPFPFPGDYSDPGIEPGLLNWQADSLSLSHLRSPNYFVVVQAPSRV